MDTGHYVTGDGVDLKLKMQLQHFDFSAHAGRTQLFDFIKTIRPEKVLAMHGDNCERFATEVRGRFGIKAEAPKNGASIKV
jgi:putative mRNA 3-end processing factor